jgi:hypothetical protein
MFHATCYYDPISYSPLNLKRHYLSPQSASSLGLWNLAAVFQRQHEFEKEKCERRCEKMGKGKIQNLEPCVYDFKLLRFLVNVPLLSDFCGTV